VTQITGNPLPVTDVSTGEAPPAGRKLTYSGHIPREDLFLRVLGPDSANGLLYVWHVTYDQAKDKTHAFVRPLHGKALKLIYWDDDKQSWLHHTAMDADGKLVQR
jgi:hypothetical protein